MKLSILLIGLMLLITSCATGMGKKIPQNTLDEIQSGKGKLTKAKVRKMIGAPPQVQNSRGKLRCDSYAYTGVVNYFLFTKRDKGQSFVFCYDKKDVLREVDGMQM